MHHPLWCILEMVTQGISKSSQTNGGKKVDGKASILGIVAGEHSLKSLLHVGIVESFVQLLESHVLGQLLHQNL